jgi:DNA-directed RNA polymerase subunit omega
MSPFTAINSLDRKCGDQRLSWLIECSWLVISAGVDSSDLAKRGESLIRQSSNRYLTTVRIAFRAKQRRFDDFDGLLEESSVKPVQRAIVELSDEQDQPDLLPG